MVLSVCVRDRYKHVYARLVHMDQKGEDDSPDNGREGE